MIRRLFALIGLAALPLAAPHTAGGAQAVGGDALRPAPSSDAPAKGAVTRAAVAGDEHRAADGSAPLAAAPSDDGFEPAAAPSGYTHLAGLPPASTRHLLPPSRAPPA